MGRGGMIRVFFFLLLVLGYPLAVGAEEGPLATVLARLQRAAAGVQSLESDFVQEKELAMFATPVRSRGHLAFMRERRLRWELLEPYQSGFVLDGERGRRWHALQETDEVFHIGSDPLMQAIAEQLLAWFRADFVRLQQQYQFELLATTPARIRLYPRDSTSPLKSIDISFAPDDRSITQVELQEPDGDRTRLRFEHTVLNPDLDPSLFR